MIGSFDHIADLLPAANGIMVARRDPGIAIHIAEIAVVQKTLKRRPTRALRFTQLFILSHDYVNSIN